MILRLGLAYDGTGFPAGRRSRGCGRCRGCCRRRSTACTRAGRRCTSRGARTPACTPWPRSRAARSAPGRRSPQRRAALTDALPPDVAVTDVAEAPAGFHARHSARARAYVYRVQRRAAARPAAGAARLPLAGAARSGGCSTRAPRRSSAAHDFRAFTPAETQHRELRAHRRTTAAGARWATSCGWRSPPTRSCATRCGRWSGTMLDGVREPAPLGGLLAGAPRSDAGPTAPPCGLFLSGVRYEGDPAGIELAGFG